MNEGMIDHPSSEHTTLIAVVNYSLKKKSVLNGIQNHDLCDTGAVLWTCCEFVVDISVDGEDTSEYIKIIHVSLNC